MFSPLICLNSRPFIFINSPPLLPFFSISGTCLDGGEVAGIVIGCFLLLILILILFIFLWRRRNRGRRRRGMPQFPILGVLFHCFYKQGVFWFAFCCCSARSAEKRPSAQTYSKPKGEMSINYWLESQFRVF